MAYQLDIQCNRGQLELSNSFFTDDATYSYIPSSITAPFRFRIPTSGNAYKFLYNSSITSFSGPPSNPADIYFLLNNSNFTLATQAGIATERGSFSASTATEFKYLVVSPLSDPTKRCSFKITSVSEQLASPDFWILGLEFDSGNITTLSSQEVLVSLETIFEANEGQPRSYFAPVGSSITVTGNRDEINSLLQNPFFINWSGYWTSFTLTSTEPSNASYGLGEFSMTNNTNDVLITYTITKDGVAYDPYTFYLKYKTPQQINNPNNFPL